MKVSVIVPTFNRAKQLKRLLVSFSNLKRMFPDEIIIVDDCSSDSTRELLTSWSSKNQPFNAQYIIMKTNSGPAKARNKGMEEASGDLVAFTDSDCVVHPHWVYYLHRGLKKNNIVGVGGRVLPLNNDIYSQYYTFHRILEPPETLKYLVSANCIFRKEEVIHVGGFDEDISFPGGEDIGLSIKLSKKNHKFGFEERAIVYHDYRSSLKDFKKTFFNYGRGCRIVTEKYFGGRKK